MSKISWGKCKILIKDLDEQGANWQKIPTPVKDSTTLEIEEGETQEAEIEGGEVEDEKRAKNKSTLTFEIRAAKNRHLIVADNDGVINHNYAIAVIPEDEDAPGILIDRGSMHATPSFTCAEGIKRSYKTKALTPEDDSHMVKYGKITATEVGGVITAVSIVEESVDGVSISASPSSLSFVASSAEDAEVSVSGATSITSANGNRSWLTVTYTGTTVTVAAADNSNTSARSGKVTIVANGETLIVPVTQAGASA